MTTELIAESSGRYDRSDLSLIRNGRRIRHMGNVSVLFGTEAKTRQEEVIARLAQKWEYTHGVTGPNESFGTKECWATWNPERWTQAGMVQNPILSHAQYHTSRGGTMPKFRATVVPLLHNKSKRLFFFYGVHMPLDNTDFRAQIWREVCVGLTEFIAARQEDHPRSKQVIIGDINKNSRDPHDLRMQHRYLEKPNGLVNGWRGNIPRTGGTHGPRSLLDTVFTNAEVVNQRLLKDDKSSDHRPFVTRLRWS